jgi:hypothetical protein
MRVRTIPAGALLLLAFAAAASAAPLPGVKTPTRNISCFWDPIKQSATAPITPRTRGTLLCDIHHASYLRAQQSGCQARTGLDWHGFSLAPTGRAVPVCSGGILYDIGRDTPVFRVLAYGRTWRYRGFTCSSRIMGLTCRNGRGHGLFLSRESFRLW